MYRILIVDDEDIVRQGLKKILLGMNSGFGGIEEAADGLEALEVFHATRPDIVITDIKMPGLDGLELVEAIRKTDRNVKIIILSGYGEFSYAQKAIQYDVADYLLKPFKKEKLYELMTGILAGLEEENRQTADKTNYMKTLSMLQEKVMKEVLRNEYKAFEIASVLENAGFRFGLGGFLALSLHVRPDDSPQVLHSDPVKLRSRLAGMEYSLYRFPVKSGSLLYLFNLEQAAAEKLLDCIRQEPALLGTGSSGKRLPVGASEWRTGLEELPLLAQQAGKALDHRLFCWDRPLLLFSEFPEKMQSLPSQPASGYEAIEMAVSARNPAELNKAVDRLFEHMIGYEQCSPELVLHILKNLILRLAKHPDGTYTGYPFFLASLDDVDSCYQASESLLELRDRIKKLLAGRMEEEDGHRESVDNSAVGYAVRYMEKNFRKAISLDVVANVVSMNSNYFSSLFRKKTGSSFVKYLQKLRVEEAKKLLADPLKRNYEIAAEIGFENDKYFCRVFKEQTGFTPQEYREQLGSGRK